MPGPLMFFLFLNQKTRQRTYYSPVLSRLLMAHYNDAERATALSHGGREAAGGVLEVREGFVGLLRSGPAQLLAQNPEVPCRAFR